MSQTTNHCSNFIQYALTLFVYFKFHFILLCNYEKTSLRTFMAELIFQMKMNFHESRNFFMFGDKVYIHKIIDVGLINKINVEKFNTFILGVNSATCYYLLRENYILNIHLLLQNIYCWSTYYLVLHFVC